MSLDRMFELVKLFWFNGAPVEPEEQTACTRERRNLSSRTYCIIRSCCCEALTAIAMRGSWTAGHEFAFHDVEEREKNN